MTRRTRRRRPAAIIALLALAGLPAGCAAPPLTVYTLGLPSAAAGPGDTPTRAVGPATPVIEVGRATVPDYLDTQDIVLRQGDRLARSSRGRWASRLSVAVTDLIVARLGERRPGVLVTSQPQVTPPTYRLAIEISRLDVGGDGAAALEANWSFVPRDATAPIVRCRAAVAASGPVGADPEVAALTRALLDRLAARIEASLAAGPDGAPRPAC